MGVKGAADAAAEPLRACTPRFVAARFMGRTATRKIRPWLPRLAAFQEQAMSRHKIVDHSIEARAERRVRRKMGFLIHLTVFVAVNGGLYAINAMTGEARWAHFPLLGWGLGLAIHGLVTWISLQGESARRGLVAREIESLR